MKIVAFRQEESFDITTPQGCNACNAARIVKDVLGDPSITKIIIEVT